MAFWGSWLLSWGSLLTLQTAYHDAISETSVSRRTLQKLRRFLTKQRIHPQILKIYAAIYVKSFHFHCEQNFLTGAAAFAKMKPLWTKRKCVDGEKTIFFCVQRAAGWCKAVQRVSVTGPWAAGLKKIVFSPSTHLRLIQSELSLTSFPGSVKQFYSQWKWNDFT